MVRQPSHKRNLKLTGRDSSRERPVVRESTKRWTKARVRAVNKPHEIKSSWHSEKETYSQRWQSQRSWCSQSQRSGRVSQSQCWGVRHSVADYRSHVMQRFLLDDSIETVNGIGHVVHTSFGTVRFDQRIRTANHVTVSDFLLRFLIARMRIL